MPKRIIPPLISLFLVCLAAFAFFKQDALYDMWRLRGYQAPAEIAQLADVTTMNESARRLFYVYRPILDDRSSFNTHCNNAEQTIVLGCYIEYRGIYLYKVSDQRLKGVIEVTAAHEMLHAAYDRLNNKDRKRIDDLTNQVAQGLTDERLKETIENYRKKDAQIVPNELHSILATEVRNLPPELDDYYKRYFTNRAAIVDLADSYKQAFREREDQVTTIDKQLETLKSQIDVTEKTISEQQALLKSQYDNLQQKKQSGTAEQYNAAIPAYNQLVSNYNVAINRQKQLVSQYNKLVQDRNTIATEENELIEAIDSRAPVKQE